MTIDANIVLVGCGKMGGALLQGWLSQGIDPARIMVVDPVAETVPEGVKLVQSAREINKDFPIDIIVLAVKPQVIDKVLPDYADKDVLFLSIAAGRRLDVLEKRLNDKAIIRAMPNLTALIGQGVTVAVANKNVSDVQMVRCTKLLEVVGEVHWLENEALMDAVTALSGSGPAYVFHFIECLIEAGKALGLPDTLSAALAKSVARGSGNMAFDTQESPGALCENVTSPGGTTEAALAVLMGNNALQELLSAALSAAEERSKELNS